MRPSLLGLMGCLIVTSPSSVLAQATPDVPPTLPRALLEEKEETSDTQPEEEEDSGALTIEEIVNSLVVSASNREEGSLRAPAWIITLTHEDLKNRGYTELSDVFDDLPSMDIIRPYGDPYFKNYWRGYRNTIGAPYLLMVDGVIFNQLWLNEATIMAAMPMSNIERVEILYGPASAVYGPNAAMGVVNIITKSDHKVLTSKVKSYFGLRAPTKSYKQFGQMTKIADASFFHKSSNFRTSVTARFEQGILDPNIGDNFEWLKNKYYSDRKIWGDFVDYPDLAGQFNSQIEKQAIDARLYLGNTEFAAQYFSLLSGTGASYAADKLQARAIYALTEKSAYIRHNENFGDALLSKTLIRYRESNVDSPTNSLERDPTDNSINFSYWLSLNRSLTASQDFTLLAGQNLLLKGDELVVNTGMAYERRDLDKAYLKSGGDVKWDPGVKFVDDDGEMSYTFPLPQSHEANLQNRSTLDAVGLYLLSRYNFFSDHSVDIGGRLDYNELLNSYESTFRGGYVGQFIDQLTIKLLYGQAVQEPTWRQLFGAWSGTGSNPGLKSERSQTGEVSVSYSIDWFYAQANTYVVNYTDAIISTNSSGQNIGDRLVVGADFGIQALPPVPGVQQMKVWAYYSPFFYAKESESSDSDKMVDIGDLASHKIIVGITATLNDQFGATLMGRCASARKPVRTNPLSFETTCTADTNIFLRNIFVDGLSLNLKGTNILDAKNFHPGVADADSGNTPGRWEGSTWVGSGQGGYSGYYNSKLPQPGRALTLSLQLDL